MKKYLLTALLILTSLVTFAQGAGMILTHRNYIHSQRPRFIPFLTDSTTNLYKTSVDSLFIRPVQVIGLQTVATSASYNDLNNLPNLGNYLLKSDTASMLSSYTKSGQLGYYLLKSDTASMLSEYLRKNALTGYAKLTDLVSQVQSDWNSTSGVSQILNKPTIPTNTNQLMNGAGFLTSFTELDPSIPAYSKSLTAFSVIKSSTDPLYKPISYAPTWTEVTSKPTFATVATSGNYNDLSSKPTIVQQLGTTYTKEYNTEVTTSASTSSYTVTATGISSVISVQATGFYSGATFATAPLIAVSSISGNVVTLTVAESASTGVLIGGTVEGLTEFLKVGKIYVTIKGN